MNETGSVQKQDIDRLRYQLEAIIELLKKLLEAVKEHQDG